MIVQKQLNVPAMLFAFRGTVMPRIWPHILLVAAVAVGVCAVTEWRPGLLPEISVAPFSLLGLVLSIFLGFRNNVCYERWWEGRKQWGMAIGHSRALRAKFPPSCPTTASARPASFAVSPVSQPVWRRGCATATRPPRSRPGCPSPKPRRCLDCATSRARRSRGSRAISPRRSAKAGFGEITLQTLESHVEGLSAVQSACERISTTPTPFSYSLLLHRTCWIFCLLAPFGLVGALGWITPFFSVLLAYAFFGLDALGDELEQPFGLMPNHLPLDAMVRIIEIEMLQALGETALPEPLAPENGRLT